MSKKMIFSAIALTAFSFAGMASEIEDTKVEKHSNIAPMECWEAFISDYAKARDMGFSHQSAGKIAEDNYKRCEAKKVKSVSAQ